eukprot:COSAG01_NODE_35349_length_533_cov_0.910138_2_plen_71_part_00
MLKRSPGVEAVAAWAPALLDCPPAHFSGLVREAAVAARSSGVEAASEVVLELVREVLRARHVGSGQVRDE